MSLLSMAALNLDSTDADAFGTACNNVLIQYCQTFFQVDEGSTPTTVVYNQADVGSPPVGYDASFQPKISAPCSIVEYGSGGIVSNGADMAQFPLCHVAELPRTDVHAVQDARPVLPSSSPSEGRRSGRRSPRVA
jgi:hypothetical protein